ncbi:MAG: hypothetical protein HGA79_08635 [Anaerolineales bacterium]|nr:hypothetical protein [Anaerolineales bacterium]
MGILRMISEVIRFAWPWTTHYEIVNAIATRKGSDPVMWTYQPEEEI